MKPRAIDLSGVTQPPTLVGVMILLDRSGSMSSIQAPMEAAFEKFLADQKEAMPDGMWLSLHQFDSGQSGQLKYQKVYDRKPLLEVGPLGLQPSGGTPLRDALWRFGREARSVIDDVNDPTESLVLIIITDGEENTSKAHSWSEVRKLIQGLESSACETVWLGTSSALLQAQAEVPTFAQAGGSLSYTPDASGVMYAAQGFTAAVASARVGTLTRSAMATYTSAGDADSASSVTADYLAQLKNVSATRTGGGTGQ